MAAVTVAELPFRPDTPLESEDDDNFNTANARIHFGQLKSPEKKIRSEVLGSVQTPVNQRTVRRSARLSGGSDVATPEQPQGEPSEPPAPVEPADTPERATTPDSGELEEPQSQLASRIMSAHDNPSPPPQSPLNLPGEDDSRPSSPHSNANLLPIPFILPTSPSPDDHSRDSLNLMSFNSASFSLSPRQPIDAGPQTMDFLTGSPSMALMVPSVNVAPAEAPLSPNSMLIPVSPTQSKAEEEAVAEELFAPAPPSDLPSPSPQPPASGSPSRSDTPEAPQLLEVPPASEEPSRSPSPGNDAGPSDASPFSMKSPRRSSRPRRSVVPFTIPTTPAKSPYKEEGSVKKRKSTQDSRSRRKSRGPAQFQSKEDSNSPDHDPLFVQPSPMRQASPTRPLFPVRDFQAFETPQPSPSRRSRSPERPRIHDASAYAREVGSLSPNAVNVLGNLAFAALAEADNEMEVDKPDSAPAAVDAEAEGGEEDPVEPPASSTPTPEEPIVATEATDTASNDEAIASENIAPSTPPPHAPSLPMRFPSPTKSSPTKMKMVIKPGDVSESPARRVPAKATAFPSPAKGGSSTAAPAKFTIPRGAGTQESPARRVPAAMSKIPSTPLRGLRLQAPSSVSRPPSRVPEPSSALRQPTSASRPPSSITRPPSAIRPPSVERNASVEPRLPALTFERSRSASAEPPSSAISRAKGKARATSVEPKGRSASVEPPSATAKMKLAQRQLPFPFTAIAEEPEEAKESAADVGTPEGAAGSSTAAVKSRLRQPVAGSALKVKSTTRIPRMGKPYARPPSATKPAVTKPTPTAVKPPSTATKPASSSSRAGSSTQASSSKSVHMSINGGKKMRMVDLTREVPKRHEPEVPSATTGTVTVTKKTSPPTRTARGVRSPPQTSDTADSAADARKRKTDDVAADSPPKRRKQNNGSSSPPTPPAPLADAAPSSDHDMASEHAGGATPLPPSEPSASAQQQEQASSPPRPAAPEPVDSPEKRVASHLQPTQPLAVRRTTRSRRGGTEPPQTPAPAPRRARVVHAPTDALGGMSAVALRALTNANTQKNQDYLAARIETEIIRREGDRPDSPAMKMKSNGQKEQEARSHARKERAERRARRAANGEEGDGSFVSAEGSEDGYSTPERPQRHRRGPGDEEDYETPMKIGRLRFDGGAQEEEAEEAARRVKWDRALQTAKCLEDILPHPPKASTLPERSLKKGCLSAAAKALQLDTLGNLEATSPLKDLVPENVVVKKFVYDNDEEAQPEPPPPEPKVTRSRKKAKA